MLKPALLITFLLGISFTISSQGLKLLCGDKEVNCANGNKHHFEMIVNCPYEETDTLHLPKTIRDKSKKYLIERIGKEFYNKLNYYSSQIIDFNKYLEIKKQKGWISSTSDKRIKYAIQYYFSVQEGMRYYISVVFDKNGNIISKQQLPDHKKNEQFDKIISVCDAKLIAEQDSIFPGILLNISLEYLASANTFVWKVKKPSIPGIKPEETIYRYILINAVSGQIIKRESETWTMLCNYSSF